jgi:transposase-like protein
VRARVKVPCPVCGAPTAVTDAGRFWRHGNPRCHKSYRTWSGREWRTRIGKRRITLTPGPDTWNPTQGAA